MIDPGLAPCGEVSRGLRTGLSPGGSVGVLLSPDERGEMSLTSSKRGGLVFNSCMSLATALGSITLGVVSPGTS